MDIFPGGDGDSDRTHDIFRPEVGYPGRFSVPPGRRSEHLVLASTNKMTYPGRFDSLHWQLVLYQGRSKFILLPYRYGYVHLVVHC